MQEVVEIAVPHAVVDHSPQYVLPAAEIPGQLTDREARLQVDPGVQSGKILRMRERGLPELNGPRFGDQMVRVNVWTPRSLTREEEAMLEKLRASPSFQPNPDAEEERKSFFSKVKDVFS